jgi:hypothetical protein
MFKKHMKKCSPCLAIKETQIKTMLRSTSPLLEWLASGTPPTTNVGEDVWKKQPLYTAGGNVC